MKKRLELSILLSVAFQVCALAQAPFADLHCHSMLKPFYSKGWDVWAFHEHECAPEAYGMVLEKSEDVPKFTQSNFESMILGNVKHAYLSLTPLEYEMRHPKIFRDLEKLRNSYACMVGITPDWSFFLDKQVDYFAELMANIQMLSEGDAKLYIAGPDTLSYEIIRSQAHYRKVLASKNKLAVVLSIEGAHSLGVGPLRPELLSSPDYRDEVLEHIEVLKGSRPVPATGAILPYPIAIMTLNHFMYNGLSGHAKTFGQIEGYFLDQSEGMNTGVTKLGEQVIAKLLDKQAGRRILIDVKHMGIESRQWYYAYLDALRAAGDTIPVVATHAGVAGRSWCGVNTAKNGNDLNKSAWLNQSPISMFDEDLQEILMTRGILGLMLDKYRLGGDLGKELVDATREGSVQRRRAYVHLIVANMLAIVDYLKCKEAWDIISIGSDYDGLISAMETYDQAIKLPSLRDDLLDFFEAPEDVFDVYHRRKVQRLMYGLSAQEIVDKVMGGNLIAFTDRIFGDDLGIMGGNAAEGKD